MPLPEYIFTYGSLVNSLSRGGRETCWRVILSRVYGYECGWYVPVPEDQSTGLGIVKKESAVINGILLDITDDKKLLLDKREIQHGYIRRRIPEKFVNLLSGDSLHKSIVWSYVVDSREKPSNECPITQSYLDVVLSGYLEIGEDYAVEFIKNTKCWDSIWINDRLSPRYRRHLKSDFIKIDRLLCSTIPDEFIKRIEIR